MQNIDPQSALADPVAQQLFRGVDPERMRREGFTAEQIAGFCGEVACYKKHLIARRTAQVAHLAKLKAKVSDQLARVAKLRIEAHQLERRHKSQSVPVNFGTLATPAKPSARPSAPPATKPQKSIHHTFRDASDLTLTKAASGKAGPSFVAGAEAELSRRGWSKLSKGGWASPSKSPK